MKITIRASGLIKSGPERELIDDYIMRANGLASNLGVSGVEESAIDTRKAKSRSHETQMILASVDNSSKLVILDERGKALTSRQMAKQIANWRDDGTRHLVFAIGGADGFDSAALSPALAARTVKWSFGTQVWPHKLVRVMIAEQLYRALAILAGTPYHRD